MFNRLHLYFCILLIFFPIFIDARREKDSKKSKPVKIAFCLTGQLARLELISKIYNIFLPNAEVGNTVHIFILLDNQVDDVKQTFWKYDYSDSPYLKFDSQRMANFIFRKAENNGLQNLVEVNVRLEDPSQEHFQVVGHVIPVADKIVKNPFKGMGGEMPKDGIEPAAARFQNNMRWLAGLRDCVRWVQQEEFEQGEFYDLVVRLRDDTYAFGNWILTYDQYGNALTSARTGGFRGINDHNFVVDRAWADPLFRGFTEDYYFNKTLQKELWGNPEHRIYQIATANNVPIQNTTVCEQPLIPLRGKYNSSHWLLHASYTSKFEEECREAKRKGECICDSSWIKMFKNGYVPIDSEG